MNIIGIGQAGCQITKLFENLEQYAPHYVDTHDDGYSNFFKVKKQDSHEEYEKKFRKINFNLDDEDVTIIMSGTGNVSGCSLRILEQLKNKRVTVIYIKPDYSHLSQAQKIKHKITFGILQEYARSNLLNMLYVISNKEVESALEEIPLRDYWQSINNVIFSTYHMINVFRNTEPILTTCAPLAPTTRIATFGVVNYHTNKEKLFYDLQCPRNKNYFFGINDLTLEQDKEILHKIRSFVGEKSNEKVDAGFAIYPTNYERNYVYSVHCSTLVQEQEI